MWVLAVGAGLDQMSCADERIMDWLLIPGGRIVMEFVRVYHECETSYTEGENESSNSIPESSTITDSSTDNSVSQTQSSSEVFALDLVLSSLLPWLIVSVPLLAAMYGSWLRTKIFYESEYTATPDQNTNGRLGTERSNRPTDGYGDDYTTDGDIN